VENAGVEKAGVDSRGGNAGVENAGVDNRGGKCRSKPYSRDYIEKA